MTGARPQPFDLAGPAEPPPAEPASAESDFELAPRPAGEPPAGPATPLAPLAAAAPAAADERGPSSWPIYVAAMIASLAWLAAPAFDLLSHPARLTAMQGQPTAIASLATSVLAPIALIWVAAFLAEQGRRMAAETRRARALAASLLAPAAIAAREAGEVVAAVRAEIERATAAAVDAQARLGDLRDALAAEGERMAKAAGDSTAAATAAAEALGGEREKLEGASAALDARVTAVSEAIAGHVRIVGEASDLAETQIREAQAALAARAADLAAAAGQAGDAAKLAADTLAGQLERLEAVSASAGEQAEAIEQSMAEQRAGLVTAAHGMRADQESYAVEAERLKAQLAELVERAHAGAIELAQTATSSAEAIRQMIAAAQEELAAMAKAQSDERDRLNAQAARSLGAVSELAAREREALEAGAQEAAGVMTAGAEAARQAGEAHVQAVREQLAQIGEAAAAAKAQADQAFDARLGEARQLIEQASHLVDEAGARTSERLKDGANAAGATLAALQDVLREVDQRLARAPADAEVQTTAIRENVERGIEALMASARNAAEETRNIDAAFQERVRRNYDMLSEAVRLMGVVAGAGGTRASARTIQPSPAPQPAPEAPLAAAAAVASPAPPPATTSATPPAEPEGLRPRLKLTPTATDEEFKTVFAAAGGREPAETIGDSWTWKELLSSMDKPASDDASLTAAILGEIEAMGIDAATLAPRARVEEIAAALKTNGAAAGREMMRNLAPAAVRRLSRRIVADREFRGHADRYVQRYARLLADSLSHEGDGVAAPALLASDQGRAYLLLDAAMIDAGP